MIAKNIKYVDYNGVERNETFYFNLSDAEVTELECSVDGGISAYIEKIVNAQSMPKLIALFKEIIEKSYGVKSLDGKRFIKNKDVFEEFSQTEAYSKLFMELATDEKAAGEFINGVIAKKVSTQSTQNVVDAANVQ